LPSYSFRIGRQKKLASILNILKYSIYQIQNKNDSISFQKHDEFPIHKIVNESDYLILPDNLNIVDI
ncbi:MAG TPA: hypothetical protein DCR48_03625, partial [Flavobacteriales bacterium]|nr:hypothetical protein [Flavobacteriales bacterium]